MATKRELADQILRIYSNYDRTVEELPDERDIYALINQVANKKAKEGYYADYKIYDQKNPDNQQVTVFRNVPVYYEEETGRSYIKSPAKWVNLPKNRGIVSISPMKDLKKQFIVTDMNAMWAYSDSHAGVLEYNIGCYPEGSNIYFLQNIHEQGCKDVLVRLFISDTSSIDNNTLLPINASDELDIVMEVLKIMGIASQFPSDNKNDYTGNNV